jgi:hypothetical protein
MKTDEKKPKAKSRQKRSLVRDLQPKVKALKIRGGVKTYGDNRSWTTTGQ